MGLLERTKISERIGSETPTREALKQLRVGCRMSYVCIACKQSPQPHCTSQHDFTPCSLGCFDTLRLQATYQHTQYYTWALFLLSKWLVRGAIPNLHHQEKKQTKDKLLAKPVEHRTPRFDFQVEHFKQAFVLKVCAFYNL